MEATSPEVPAAPPAQAALDVPSAAASANTSSPNERPRMALASTLDQMAPLGPKDEKSGGKKDEESEEEEETKPGGKGKKKGKRAPKEVPPEADMVIQNKIYFRFFASR